MPSWGQREESPPLGKAAAGGGGASWGGWGLPPKEELQTDRRWGPVLLECSHRSKTATWPGTGPHRFPCPGQGLAPGDPSLPRPSTQAPCPGAPRAQDPPPGSRQPQLEPGPCPATRAPPGGVSPSPHPWPWPPPTSPRPPAPPGARGGSYPRRQLLRGCRGRLRYDSGPTAARATLASSCFGFLLPRFQLAGRGGPGEGKGRAAGPAPPTPAGPPAQRAARPRKRKGGGGRERMARGEPPARAPRAWAAPGSAGKRPRRGGGLAPGQSGPEGEGESLLQASPPHRIPQGELRRQPTFE